MLSLQDGAYEDSFVLLQTFSRHGIARASSALLIWLNENVALRAVDLYAAKLRYICEMAKGMREIFFEGRRR